MVVCAVPISVSGLGSSKSRVAFELPALLLPEHTSRLSETVEVCLMEVVLQVDPGSLTPIRARSFRIFSFVTQAIQVRGFAAVPIAAIGCFIMASIWALCSGVIWAFAASICSLSAGDIPLMGSPLPSPTLVNCHRPGFMLKSWAVAQVAQQLRIASASGKFFIIMSSVAAIGKLLLLQKPEPGDLVFPRLLGPAPGGNPFQWSAARAPFLSWIT